MSHFLFLSLSFRHNSISCHAILVIGASTVSTGMLPQGFGLITFVLVLLPHSHFLLHFLIFFVVFVIFVSLYYKQDFNNWWITMWFVCIIIRLILRKCNKNKEKKKEIGYVCRIKKLNKENKESAQKW